MEIPTNEQVTAMAVAAYEAATSKAVEMGLAPIMGLLGIERAYHSAKKVLSIVAILGAEGTEKLASALKKADIYDMHREAEEAINGSEQR